MLQQNQEGRGSENVEDCSQLLNYDWDYSVLLDCNPAQEKDCLLKRFIEELAEATKKLKELSSQLIEILVYDILYKPR